jgi:hypothetical protein
MANNGHASLSTTLDYAWDLDYQMVKVSNNCGLIS